MMSDRSRVLREVIQAFQVLDNTYRKKQRVFAQTMCWEEVKRLQLIRDGIKQSIGVVNLMLDHKLEVV